MTAPPRALKKRLARLKTEQVDLYLVHWPMPSQNRHVEIWQAFIDAQQAGLVRRSVCRTFKPDHLRRIIDTTGVATAVNQIELHPYLQQPALRREHANRGVVTQGDRIGADPDRLVLNPPPSRWRQIRN